MLPFRSGYEPITVCSPGNFDFVRKIGAVAVFDYHDVDCGKKIREYTNNSLKLVWDTVSVPESAQICADALSTEAGGKYYNILFQKSPRDDVESKTTLAYYVIGEPMQMQPDGPILPPDVESFEFAKRFITIAEKLIADGKVTPHPPQIGKDGLKGVLEGLQLMREGKVSGKKLVYRVDETP
jgi:NADPH:quinone reductase-like Zn-dependent oxidoreductase